MYTLVLNDGNSKYYSYSCLKQYLSHKIKYKSTRFKIPLNYFLVILNQTIVWKSQQNDNH